jgi:predicted nuclease with TOPRIM domain
MATVKKLQQAAFDTIRETGYRLTSKISDYDLRHNPELIQKIENAYLSDKHASFKKEFEDMVVALKDAQNDEARLEKEFKEMEKEYNAAKERLSNARTLKNVKIDQQTQLYRMRTRKLESLWDGFFDELDEERQEKRREKSVADSKATYVPVKTSKRAKVVE